MVLRTSSCYWPATTLNIQSIIGSNMSLSSKITTLSLLDAYSQIHAQAQADQKNFIWQITKARRAKSIGGALMMGSDILAEDVREDLRAATVLKLKSDEPELVQEEGTTKMDPKMEESPIRLFELVNVHALEQQQQQQRAKTLSSGGNVDDENTGLRRRKGNNDSEVHKDTDNAWTVENKAKDYDEEELLRRADPLTLFGAMPPKELRQAQKEAVKALAAYVEAANLLVAIQQSLPSRK
jgi:hypothetical protein